jgi:hypothetical protein
MKNRIEKKSNQKCNIFFERSYNWVTWESNPELIG